MSNVRVICKIAPAYPGTLTAPVPIDDAGQRGRSIAKFARIGDVFQLTTEEINKWNEDPAHSEKITASKYRIADRAPVYEGDGDVIVTYYLHPIE